MLPYVCRRFVSYRQGVILGVGGATVSFLVKSKCMARGSLNKKKKNETKKVLKKKIYFLSCTFAMAAHIFPIPWRRKSLSENILKKKKGWKRTSHSCHRCRVATLHFCQTPKLWFLPPSTSPPPTTPWSCFVFFLFAPPPPLPEMYFYFENRKH